VNDVVEAPIHALRGKLGSIAYRFFTDYKEKCVIVEAFLFESKRSGDHRCCDSLCVADPASDEPFAVIRNFWHKVWGYRVQMRCHQDFGGA
jgi:hypothetical protein